MAWIRVIDPEGADGQLRDIYRAIASARGGIADVHESAVTQRAGTSRPS